MRVLALLSMLAQHSALPDGKQPTPMQSATLVDVDALVEEAAEIGPAFHKSLRALVEEHGGDYLQGPNKTRARAIEKVRGLLSYASAPAQTVFHPKPPPSLD